MEDDELGPPTPILPSKELEAKIIDTKIYSLSLSNQEFELIVNLTSDFLEFKLQQKNIISYCYYKAKYDLISLNNKLFTFFKETKEVFTFYDKILNKKKVKLLEIKEKKTINLNFKNIVNFDEEVETNIELEQIKFNKDDIYLLLLNEVNSLKKILSSKNEKTNEEFAKENEIKIKEYINQKINESKQEIIQKYEKIIEDKIKEKDNEIKGLKEEIKILNNGQEKIIKELQNKLNPKLLEIEKGLKPILDERN